MSEHRRRFVAAHPWLRPVVWMTLIVPRAIGRGKRSLCQTGRWKPRASNATQMMVPVPSAPGLLHVCANYHHEGLDLFNHKRYIVNYV
jgi:hypothetical protein